MTPTPARLRLIAAMLRLILRHSPWPSEIEDAAKRIEELERHIEESKKPKARKMEPTHA